MHVEASREAIQRAFVFVMAAITSRLKVTVESSDTTNTLVEQFGQLTLQPEALGSLLVGTSVLHEGRVPTRGGRRGAAVQLFSTSADIDDEAVDIDAESASDARYSAEDGEDRGRRGRGRGRGRGQHRQG